jgi:hypothetical protein
MGEFTDKSTLPTVYTHISDPTRPRCSRTALFTVLAVVAALLLDGSQIGQLSINVDDIFVNVSQVRRMSK